MTRRPETLRLACAPLIRRAPVLLLLAALSWVGFGSAPAAAHTELRSSSPADGQRLQAAPETIELVFNQAIAKNFASIVVRTGPGRQPTELDLSVEGATVSAAVPPELTGATARRRTVWTVAYRVVSEDGHPITGQLRFTLAPQPGTSTSPTPSPAPSARTRPGSSAPDGPGRDGAGDSGSTALSTVVIGLFTAVATVGVMYLLARGRARGEES